MSRTASMGLALASIMVAQPAIAEVLGRLPGPGGSPQLLEVQVPAYQGLGFSYLLPGGAQFYLGDGVRGGLYAGGALALAGLLTMLPTWQDPNFVWSFEQGSFAVVQGVGLSWLLMGTVSLIDAAIAIGHAQPELEEPAVPELRP